MPLATLVVLILLAATTDALPNNLLNSTLTVSATAAATAAAVPPTYTGVPTTTLIRTGTETAWNMQRWISPRLVEMRTTATATSLAPGPFPQLPTTVTQWVVSTVTHDTRTYFYADDGQMFEAIAGTGGPPQRIESSTDMLSATAPETYGVYRTAASYLPAVTGAMVPCGGALEDGAPEAEPDPVCAEKGLNTGCLERQCDARADELWCLQRWYGLRDSQPAMGRACWGGDGVFIQLLKPCLKGDRDVGCTKDGRSAFWVGKDWQGPGASGNPYV